MTTSAIPTIAIINYFAQTFQLAKTPNRLEGEQLCEPTTCKDIWVRKILLFYSVLISKNSHPFRTGLFIMYS